MGLLDVILGGGAGFLTRGWPGAAVGALGAMQGSAQADAAKKAADQASAMSAEQRALLSQILEWSKQYGSPALESLFSWANASPYAPSERVPYERAQEDINKAYRPVAANALQTFSNRGLLSSYNTIAPRVTSGIDRARAGELSKLATDRMVGAQNQKAERLAKVMDILSQMRGGNVSAAGAYGQPISTYTNLATQAGAGQYDWLAALANLWGQRQAQRSVPTMTMPVSYNYTNPGKMQLKYVPGSIWAGG